MQWRVGGEGAGAENGRVCPLCFIGIPNKYFKAWYYLHMLIWNKSLALPVKNMRK